MNIIGRIVKSRDHYDFTAAGTTANIIIWKRYEKCVLCENEVMKHMIEKEHHERYVNKTTTHSEMEHKYNKSIIKERKNND